MSAQACGCAAVLGAGLEVQQDLVGCDALLDEDVGRQADHLLHAAHERCGLGRLAHLLTRHRLLHEESTHRGEFDLDTPASLPPHWLIMRHITGIRLPTHLDVAPVSAGVERHGCAREDGHDLHAPRPPVLEPLLVGQVRRGPHAEVQPASTRQLRGGERETHEG